MLKSLKISHFAIIDDISIDFNSNMTTLTGETGAGKSIIIDAIGQLLGQRANSSMVKNGYDKALIESVFDISNHLLIKEKLEAFGFDYDDDLVVSKQITNDGKSTCRINYRVVNVSILKEILPLMIDIHSQFETQYLLNQKIHIDLLDQYASNDLIALKQEYQTNYKLFVKKEKELKNLLSQTSDEEQEEFYRFQLNEIEEANIQDNELTILETKKKEMEQFEYINETSRSIINDLDGQYGALSSLQSALYSLNQLSSNTFFDEIFTQYEDGFYKIQDVNDQIKQHLSSLEYDEYQFQEIQERIFIIQKIQKKYGYSIEKINAYKEDLLNKIEMIENRDVYLIKIQDDLKKLETNCFKIALEIRKIRKLFSEKLEKAITSQLKDLYMEKALFKVSIIKKNQLSLKGIDEVTFLIQTNVGQELKALNQIASGGELSRLMLALKCIFTATNQITTIIFDEVDTGVSGKVANSIGQKMKDISKNIQVICITHLPQVASYATHHLYVHKSNDEKSTYTKVKYLNNEEKVKEIATMLSGETISKSSMKNAKDLLKTNGSN
jgi:DNA repair protein RecN